MQDSKLSVIHFVRKPRPNFNYSIESIFQDIRLLLSARIKFTVFICDYFNDGYLSKILNIAEAFLRQKKDSIYHVTGEVHFLALLMHKKNVLLTIHDCRFMERKKGIEKQIIKWLYLSAPIKKSNYVTAVSENTKREIIQYTNCPPEKIKVIPNAVDIIYKPVYKIFNTQEPVILQIGTAANKNVSRLIEAIKNVSCKLVIIGNPTKDDLKKLQLNNIKFQIKFNLSNEELFSEYVSCDIVSFISTAEGFGLPIIEGNFVERAVVTSNISCMPEIAGDAACFVDPYNVTDIRKGILKLVHDQSYREQLILNGRKNRMRFDRGRIAEMYYELYQKISEQL